MIWGVAGLRPNFFSSSLIFSSGLAQKSWRDLAAVKDTLIEDQGVGQGPNVVLYLLARAGMVKGSHVYFDNLFTSLSLAGAAFRSKKRGQSSRTGWTKCPPKKKKSLRRLSLEHSWYPVPGWPSLGGAEGQQGCIYGLKHPWGVDMEKTCLPIQHGGEARSQVCLY
jgi:hypothetical protein